VLFKPAPIRLAPTSQPSAGSLEIRAAQAFNAGQYALALVTALVLIASIGLVLWAIFG